MILERFRWPVMMDTSAAVEYTVEDIKFGDGYEQIVGDSINTDRTSYSLETIGTNAMIMEVKSFLNSHKGVKPFIFKHPLLGEGVYRCLGFTLKTLSTKSSTISFTIKQAYV